MLGAARVHSHRLQRIIQDVLDADGRGEVKHLVGRLDFLVDELRIQDRSLDDPDVIALKVREPARGEVVEDRHLGTFVAKRVDEMGTDEAGASGHEGAHLVRVRHHSVRPRHALARVSARLARVSAQRAGATVPTRDSPRPRPARDRADERRGTGPHRGRPHGRPRSGAVRTAAADGSSGSRRGRRARAAPEVVRDHSHRRAGSGAEPPRRPPGSARVTSEIRAFRPHIVETHTAKAGVIGRLAAFAARAPATVHVYHGHLLHGYFSPSTTKGVVGVERLLARRTTRLVTVGRQVRDELIAAHIGRPEQYDLMTPGVDLTFGRDRRLSARRARTSGRRHPCRVRRPSGRRETTGSVRPRRATCRHRTIRRFVRRRGRGQLASVSCRRQSHDHRCSADVCTSSVGDRTLRTCTPRLTSCC